MSHTPLPEAVQRLVQFFEQLQPQDLARLPEIYAPEARFKDPFNEVQGLAAIERIFAHMFEALDGPHFIVTERIVQDTSASWSGTSVSASSALTRRPGRPCAAAPIWRSTRPARSRCTATTGTRPRNSTKSCPWWAA